MRVQYVSGGTTSCAITFFDAGTNRLTGGSFGLGVPFMAAYPAVFMLPSTSPTQNFGTAIACLSGTVPVRKLICFV